MLIKYFPEEAKTIFRSVIPTSIDAEKAHCVLVSPMIYLGDSWALLF